jgi:hypothetical protein
MDIQDLRKEIALLEESIPLLKEAWEKALAFQVRTKSKHNRYHTDFQAFDKSLKKSVKYTLDTKMHRRS